MVPEGHTLHRLALDLTQAFGGQVVSITSPQGRFAESAALLDQTRMIEATAHGKHLFCEFEGDRLLHIHLGLIGSLELGPPSPPRGEVRARIATEQAVADLRGPQLCVVRTRTEVTAQLSELGPDPLRADADPDLAWRRIRRSTRPIAALLMDQAILSGVGNVYRAEVLFRNRINPHRPGNKLTRRGWVGIWTDLVELMPHGVADNRIDTVRPEHTPEAMGRPPRQDDHGGEVYVYRRAGMACHVCGSKVRTQLLAGRNLFWCARCQRRG
jgi:endonuclease VIII